MTIWISLAKSGLRERELCLPLPSEIPGYPRELDLSCDHACTSCFFEERTTSETGLADRADRAEYELFKYLYRN